MNEVTKGKLFLAQVLGKLTGNNDSAKAAQITRKSLSAFEGQIAALKSKLVDDENVLENANEELENAIYPTTLFNDNRNYCQNIVSKQKSVDEAEENIDDTNNSIAYFTKKLNEAISGDTV